MSRERERQPTLSAVPILLDRRALLSILLASFVSSACDRRSGASTAAAPRVVSISPSTTEALFALNAGDLAVGRSRYCDYPPEVSKLPAVGGFADPSVEAILALSPTIVVGARGPAGPTIEQSLQSHGIQTYFPETESLAAIEAMLEVLGRMVDKTSEAARVVQQIRGRRDAVVAAVAGKPRVRLVMLFDVAPIVVAGPGSFPDELIRVAGGENLIVRGGAYPTIGMEHLLALDPDCIVDGAAEVHDSRRFERLRDSPGWRDLRAFKEGRVRPLANPAALRPGPRIAEGLAAVARAIHGDALAIAEPLPSPSTAPP